MSRLALALLVWAPMEALAHPVPRNQYDRTVVVHLKPGGRDGELLLQVDFRLEVDPQTVVLEDMKAFRGEVDLSKISKPIDYFAEFTRLYAPIYSRNFYTRLSSGEVAWECVKRTQTFEDEAGKPLDHLRCDFRFQAAIPVESAREVRLMIKDLNYQDYPGKILLSFVNEAGVDIVRIEAPDAKLQDLPFTERGPDEETALRTIRVHFRTPAAALPPAHAPPTRAPPEEATPPIRPAAEGEESFSLLRLFMDSNIGLFWMLLFAGAIGAVHALTPGHGKTLVAAYLVGERGTVWHAVLLGVVTTLTHTGAVLVLAAALLFMPESVSREMIQAGLGLAMGLVIVCMGLFLLLQRLAGRADHFHIGGGHDHHHHGHQHHHHGEHGHGHSHPHSPAHAADGGEARGKPVGWWRLVVLGMTGGLIPCWDAIALLVLAVGLNLFWAALPVLLAFSAGLASVLVAIGVAVVKFRNVLGDHWGESRLVRSLPIVSAVVVTLMGLWVCFEAKP